MPQKSCPEFIVEAESSAPAKLILSGEHAVLYGAPAVAAALSYRLTVSIQPLGHPGLRFSCPMLGIDALYTEAALFETAQKVADRYLSFSQGNLPIGAVLELQSDLLICALVSWLNFRSKNLQEGLYISVLSAIPLGYGLGSSAAGIVALFRALEQAFAIYAKPDIFFKEAVSIEHLRHGVSSGIDIAVCQTEMPCLYHNQQVELAFIPELKNAWLVSTGMPEVSTGICVDQARSHFVGSALVDRFARVTESIVRALATHDERGLAENIAKNHQLLCQIAVVPEKVRRFIQRIESCGAVGKLCGAGSTRGEGGGIAWVMGDLQCLKPLFEEFGYAYEPLVFAHHTALSVG